MFMPEFPPKTRHQADTVQVNLPNKTCQTANKPDMIGNSFLDLEICC